MPSNGDRPEQANGDRPEQANGDRSGESRRNVLRTAGAAAGLSLLASGPAAGAADSLQQDDEGVRISMVTVQDLGAYEFGALLAWVDSGTEVTWVNESGAHSSTAYASANDKPDRIPEGAQAWDSGTLSEEGATFSQTFDTDGVYDYYCTPHEALGMVARLVVGAPDFENQPALESPQDDLPDDAAAVIEALNTLTRTTFDIEDG